MRVKLRVVALVIGVAIGGAESGFVAPAAAELVPGGWLQSPTRVPEPVMPPPAMRPPAALPPAPVSAPRRPPPPPRPAQAPRMQAPSQPPSDGAVRF